MKAKTQIHNLIILDESGSMSGVSKQTISGCNETLDTIRTAQADFAETQEHHVSIFAFQSGGKTPSRYIVHDQPAASVRHITDGDYRPNGCTPLLDAVGDTLTDLKAVTDAQGEQAIGSVTIITDGYENSSVHYSAEQVVAMISQLKELGWNFTFIGANIDVERVAKSMKIDNSMSFKQTYEGTNAMFKFENRKRRAYYDRIDKLQMKEDEAAELKREKLRKAGYGYFDEPAPAPKPAAPANTKTLRFNKEDDGLWYVDLPSWPFSHGNLLMVGGADDLCEFLAEGKASVTVEVVPSDKPLPGMDGYAVLTRLDHSLTDGAHYSVTHCPGFTQNIYLCPVTLFVMHKYPKYMYVRK